MALPAIATPQEPRGERARVQFTSENGIVEGLVWSDWFGTARFDRDRGLNQPVGR